VGHGDLRCVKRGGGVVLSLVVGAARQAAWVLSGETEPPTWPVKVETTLTGEPTPQVYEQYVRWRG